MKFKKILALVISIALCMNLLVVNVMADEEDSAFNITRSVLPTGEIYAGQEVTITYTLTPKSFDVTEPPEKQVALVVDVSGSMGGSRISTAKTVAIDFVETLSEGRNVNVALIKYSSSASIVKNGSADFFQVDISTQEDSLISKLRYNLGTGGYTNIGDALRVAYHTLGGGNSAADQYMVFLTDGDANRYTYHEAEQTTIKNFTGYLDYDQWVDMGLGDMSYSEWLLYYKEVINWYDLDLEASFDNVPANYSGDGGDEVILSGNYTYNEWLELGYDLPGNNWNQKWKNWSDTYGLNKHKDENKNKTVFVENRYAYTEEAGSKITSFTGSANYEEYIEKKIGTLSYEAWITEYWDDIKWEEINPKAYFVDQPYSSVSSYDAYYYDSEDSGSVAGYGHSYSDNGNTTTMTGLDYAEKMADHFDYSKTGINSYYISFKDGTNNLTNISNETDGATFKYASNEEDLEKVYSGIASTIIADKSVTDLEFLEMFPEGITILEKPEGSSLTEDEAGVYWKLDEIKYALNADKTKYVAPVQTFNIVVKVDDPGKYTLGGSNNEAYLKYTDPRAALDPDNPEPIKPTVLHMEEDDLIVHKLNPPTIIMSSEEGVGSKSFTLTDNASGNMFFGGNDNIEFKGAWQKELFSSSSNTWSVYGLIQPSEISHTNDHIFMTKDGDTGTNLKVGIDSGKLLLGLKSANGTYVQKSIGSNTAISSGTLNEILISFNQGVVTAYINGVEYVENFWTEPQGLADVSNGTFNFGGSFKGRMNLVEFYDQAVTDAAIYDGSAQTLIARYTPDDVNDQGDDLGSNDVLTSSDGSGSEKDSEAVGNVYIQYSAASSLNTGATRMEYMISKDGVDGDWKVYTGTTTLRDTPGTATVYARTVLIADTSAKSDESEKTGAVKDPNYFESVHISASPTEIELYSNLNTLAKSEVTLTYELIGGEVVLGDKTAETLDINSVEFIIELDESVDVIVDADNKVVGENWLEYDDLNNQLTGILSGLKLDKVSGTMHTYKLQGDTIEFDVGVLAAGTSGLTDSNDIRIAGTLDDGKSVSISYQDLYGASKNKVAGNIVDVLVKPTKPLIDPVNGNDIVFVGNRNSVQITGKSDPNATVTVTVTDDDDPSKNDWDTVTADGNGDFVTKFFDLTDFKHDQQRNSFKVEAEVEDGDGDKNNASRPAEIFNLVLNNGIL